MARKPNKTELTPVRVDRYDAVLAEVVGLLEAARHTAARVVNSVMTATYWQIGRRIVEAEMGGQTRADYGDVLVTRLAEDLTRQFGRGFSKSNVYQMRAFYIAYQNIFQTASGKSGETPFPLPWSHYVRLLSIDNPLAREFYETEALRGGWTVK